MIFTITIGDWSQDGHNIYHEYYYETSLLNNVDITTEELREAYLKGVKNTGIDLFEECVEYEQCTLSEEATSYFARDDEYPTTEEFADYVIEIIKKGNPLIETRKIVAKSFNGWWTNDEKFNSGLGYGLFG